MVCLFSSIVCSIFCSRIGLFISWPNCSTNKFRTLATLAEWPYDIPNLEPVDFEISVVYLLKHGGGGRRSSSQTKISRSTGIGIPNDLLGNMPMILTKLGSRIYWLFQGLSLSLLIKLFFSSVIQVSLCGFLFEGKETKTKNLFMHQSQLENHIIESWS